MLTEELLANQDLYKSRSKQYGSLPQLFWNGIVRKLISSQIKRKLISCSEQ